MSGQKASAGGQGRHGLFIVLDGPDGCGKTTQLGLLRNALLSEGREIVVAREPGGTSIGEQVRRILLDPAHAGMSRKAELFLYMACRAQLVEEVLAPAFGRAAVILCDRFLSSSVAYQGFGGGLGMDEVLRIGQFCVGGLLPDRTILLDVDLATSARRRGPRVADRIEQRDDAFHLQVREGFLALARTDPAHFRVVDARKDILEIHEEIMKIVKEVL